ncbi:MAG TPA: carboxypeptidase-like regulatory domain-containing protein [Terriglobales bacterium]|nr:carboxypeptidase-like regulatory domain-containing protein [Terriglobales bacterium]
MTIQKGIKAAAALMTGVVLALCLNLFLTAPSEAQVAGATLSGEITDPSGASIANATVSIRNVGTGELREVQSNGDGFYSAPNLLPGSYEVSASAEGFSKVVQKGITLTVGAQQSLSLSLKPGKVTEVINVTDTPPDVQTTTTAVSSTVDSRTVRELPLNGRDWTSLATLEPGVASIPNQATASFNANKGNRGFGNQLTDSGHRPNENSYRLNGISINDYTNAAPGGATGLNLGVDAIQEFSVITTGYTAEYGRTSGAVINAITKSGTNHIHGTGFFFDRDSIFDARNYFDGPTIAPFRRIQFGGSAGGPIIKDRTFIFGAYEGFRQSQEASGTIHVPDAAERATAVAAIQPYLALWPLAPAGAPDVAGIQTFDANVATIANENYFITRLDHKISTADSLTGSYFFDSGPQSQADPLGNTVHQVFSRRQTGTFEETHLFGAGLVNTVRLGVSRALGKINDPVSGDAVAKDAALAIAPGAGAPPEIPVPGLTTAFALGGFNRFTHAWNSFQAADDAFLTKGKHSIKFGFAFEYMQYNVLEQLSPNGRMNTYGSLAAFLSNTPDQLNALAPGGSHEVGLREKLFAPYIQDDWRVRPNLTVNLGLRYEATTRPTDSNTVPGYTVNGYSVAAAGFQEIVSISNCLSSPTACGPIGVNSPLLKNPTTKNFEPRIGLDWDPFKKGKTVVRAGFGMFDVLPLPYEFGLNTAATAPFQIIGAAPAATLGTGINPNVNFNEQKIRNRFIDAFPHRAYVMNWNFNIQQELAPGYTLFLGYVGSRSLHLSAAADDINLVQPTAVSDVGLVFPCDPSLLAAGNTCANQQTGTRIDPNWGGGAGIRPVLYDGASSYNSLQAQLKKSFSQGVQGQVSYTFGKCRDLSSAPVTGDSYLNSIAVPLLLVKSARLGACDFDVRQVLTGTLMWSLPSIKNSSGFVNTLTGGWELGTIVTATTGAPFTATVGDGNDPLGTGFNGDFSMDFASLTPGCNPIHGGVNYLNTNCFTPPTAPSSFPIATAANPLGCAPGSYPASPVAPPTGTEFCSNVLGNTGRNRFYGPGLTTVDFSIFKNTRIPSISEAFNIQFRAEFFNILNHTNFLSPGFLNTFGQNNSVYDFNGASLPTALNQTATTSRQIQLGLKLIF